MEIEKRDAHIGIVNQCVGSCRIPGLSDLEDRQDDHLPVMSKTEKIVAREDRGRDRIDDHESRRLLDDDIIDQRPVLRVGKRPGES